MSALPESSLLADAEPIAEAAPAAVRTRQARVVWGDRVVTVGGDGLTPGRQVKL